MSYMENSLKSPKEQSSDLDRCGQLLMDKQILKYPYLFRDTNEMKDDVILAPNPLKHDLDYDKKKTCRKLSVCSDNSVTSLISNEVEFQTNSTLSVDVIKEDESTFSNELMSDIEEYFEYLEIHGRKCRRKMRKRIVIEEEKTKKPVCDSSSNDASGLEDVEKIDEDNQKKVTDDYMADLKISEPNDVQDKLFELKPPALRRPSVDKFRVSKSQFLRNINHENFSLIGYGNDLMNDLINKTPTLLTNYMYRFGSIDFEEPVIDTRLSFKLLEDINSSWMNPFEPNPLQKTFKSIYYTKNCRQKNKEENHSASRITQMKSMAGLSLDEDLKSDEEIVEDYGDEDESEESEEESDERKETVSSNATMVDLESLDSVFEDPFDTGLDGPSILTSPKSFLNLSILSESKDIHSFILEETNPTPYLIFDDEAKEGDCDIAGGPVDALIVYACDGREHLLFLGAFLDTYRTFIKPEDLIHRLIVRYKFFRSKIPLSWVSEQKLSISESRSSENMDGNVRLRSKTDRYEDSNKKCIHIISLLLTIIGKLKRDLNDRINTQIQIFEKYLLEINENQWVYFIKNAIKTQKHVMERDNEMVQLINKLSTSPPASTLPRFSSISHTFGNKKSNIFEFSSKDIAKQMTLLDWSKYRDVELFEVLNMKDIANCKLPGVIEYAKHFQNVRCWTQSILLDPDRKNISDRDRYCWKFLKIMKHLQHLNNFSSLIAILLAIQLLPLNRLFSKRIIAKIMEMENYMKPTRFAGYKQDLKEALAPCIPFLGLFYQDIVMLNIANSPYLDLDEVSRVARVSNSSISNKQRLSEITEQCGPIINFWRSFKQYIFLKNCNKDQDQIRYSIRPNVKILSFLHNFQDAFDEAFIQRLIKQI